MSELYEAQAEIPEAAPRPDVSLSAGAADDCAKAAEPEEPGAADPEKDDEERTSDLGDEPAEPGVPPEPGAGDALTDRAGPEAPGAATAEPLAPEGAPLLGDFLGRVRDAVSSRRGPSDQPADRYAMVDRPDFDEMAWPEEGVTLARYGNPLDRPDGQRIPLFDGTPAREQTKQGALNDCGIVSTMGAVAGHRPSAISECVREVGDGNYEVTLHQTKSTFDGDWRHYAPTGAVTVLTVTPELPVSTMSPEKPLYAKSGEGDVAWPSVLEKAIAGVDQTWDDERNKPDEGYLRLDRGSFPNHRAELLTQLTGEPAYTEDFPTGYDLQGRSQDRQLLDTFRAKLSDGCPVLVGTVSLEPGQERLPKKLIEGHAYELTKVDDRGLLHLRNPHNARPPEPLTAGEFRNYIKNRYTTLESRDDQ
ncbi:C2 family cysteine protease [Streptomyces sp. NPDC046316]|uniref:C2 family cysteine protease n=1 Tax=Streptomyces sp. NPDC046316 TaxID=3154494 RepID=UPI0033CE5FF9